MGHHRALSLSVVCSENGQKTFCFPPSLPYLGSLSAHINRDRIAASPGEILREPGGKVSPASCYLNICSARLCHASCPGQQLCTAGRKRDGQLHPGTIAFLQGLGIACFILLQVEYFLLWQNFKSNPQPTHESTHTKQGGNQLLSPQRTAIKQRCQTDTDHS